MGTLAKSKYLLYSDMNPLGLLQSACLACSKDFSKNLKPVFDTLHKMSKSDMPPGCLHLQTLHLNDTYSVI